MGAAARVLDPNHENRLNFEAKQREEAARLEEERRNKGFTQVYDRGWERMREILTRSKSRVPMLLYSWLAQHIDRDGGVLVADQETICEELGCSRTTLWRACTFLEQEEALFRLQVGGSVYAYALDPREVWKSWDSTKKHAVFLSRTMVRKSAQSDDIVRRMKIMMKQRGIPVQQEQDEPASD